MESDIFEIIEFALSKAGYVIADGEGYSIIVRHGNSDRHYRIQVAEELSDDYTSICPGTEVWYSDFDIGSVEHGTIQTVSFMGGSVDCFGVEWDNGDFDVYDGEGLGEYYFLHLQGDGG